MAFKDCILEEGIYYVTWTCCYGEWDCEEAWYWLVSRFHGAVNTIVDRNSECGISWKEKPDFLEATPRNVFNWAKKQKAL